VASQKNRVVAMQKHVAMQMHSVFAAMVMLVVGAIAFQSMRADAVTSASQALTQTISPIELMQNARDLPVEQIDNAI
jgi:hypothetical protein